MSEFILHHYAMSPFSEKLRAMLGYGAVTWQSVISKEMPPRPHLATLAGGYRKVPVAQMGADIFCDSHIIASEIAALTQKPMLALENLDGGQQAFIERVDSEIFFACILSGNSAAMLRKSRQTLSIFGLMKFFWDRIQLGRSMSSSVVSPKQAPVVLEKHVEQLEAMLSQPYLFGSEPTHADFSAYHGLWFVRDLAEKQTLAAYSKVNSWMDRIKQLGHGSVRPLSIEGALQIAAKAEPRPVADVDQSDPLQGKRVAIAPSDYGQVPSQGVLVGSNAQRWILQREAPGVGRVHVHFPRRGFQIQPI